MAEPRNAENPDAPNQAANTQPAEASPESVESGITNRPIEEEQREQQNLPPRGESRPD
jgi:hypothetical protein